METPSNRIFLRVSNHRAYVWDVEDIKSLRSQHRICGLLGGTLPHLSQQNVFLGVPLMLMPEEVVLLVENGSLKFDTPPDCIESDMNIQEIAAIVDDAHAHEEPSESDKEEWNRMRKLEQRREAEQKSSITGDVSARKSMTEEAILKRRQREERRAAALAQNSDIIGEGDELRSTSLGPVKGSRPTSPASTLGSTSTYTVNIPTSSTPLKWYRPSKYTYYSLAAAGDAGVWNYPSSSEERARCGVYRALWEKGYYMGCGIKFGGEYLVYPGDPLRYHSHYTASVLESPSFPLRPMEIIAHGRLGTATKKAHLLCSWDEENQKADIFSIEWAGFG